MTRYFWESKSFKKSAIIVALLAVALAPRAFADADYDDFRKELDDLEARIQAHLKEANEASFWKSEHTVPPPIAGTKQAEAPARKAADQKEAVKETQKPKKTSKPAPAKETQKDKQELPKTATAAAVPAPPQKTSVGSGSTAPVAIPAVTQDAGQPAVAVVAPKAPLDYQTPLTAAQPAAAAAAAPDDRMWTPAASLAAPAPDTAYSAPAGPESGEEDEDSRVRISGRYRASLGAAGKGYFSINDSNSDLQDRDFHYLFGDDQENTYDPAIFSQYLLNIDADLGPRTSFYTQIVADPWSYVGKTDQIQVFNVGNSDHFFLRQKYWGPNNSTVPVSVRSDDRNAIATPLLESKDGKTQPYIVRGFNDFNTSYAVPVQDIDTEFRPFRKMWVDQKGDIWHLRLFGLADQNQVMTTDDPLGLSNTKDFWQHSAWLDEWKPIQVFSDGSIRRGHYDVEDAYNAKDSNGNYLTLLRGAAMEADFGRTYVGSMIASRFGLWDDYRDINNIPAVLRIKHQLTPQLMVGGLYTYRVGMVDREPDSYNQVISADTKYYINPTDYLYGQAAGSRHELDRLTGYQVAENTVRSDYEGQAYRAGFFWEMNGLNQSVHKVNGDFAWMDIKFQPALAKYTDLRDDEFWGRYITWAEIPYDVRPFKIGTGLDRGRYVGRLTVDSEIPQAGINHIFDTRHVRDTQSNSFIEHVTRSELTYQMTPTVALKTFGRWHVLPKTLENVEPFLTGFVSPYQDDPALSGLRLENLAIDSGLDASRRTYGIGLQWEPSPTWILDGSFSRTNDIPDFPRGLQNDTFLTTTIADPDNPNVRLDRVQQFLYLQYIYDLPPYDYFSIFKERVTWKAAEGLQFIFHAAQNSYSLWGPIDENFNHQGISVDYQINERWAYFTDYTHSWLANIPRFISTANDPTPILEFGSHHNMYHRIRYQINSHTALNAEYGVFGNNLYHGGSSALPINAYSVTTFSLPTIDTEHIFRVTMDGEF